MALRRAASVVAAVLLALTTLLQPACAQHGHGHHQEVVPQGPPQPIVVPLPQDPVSDCGSAVFHVFTKRYRSCFWSIYHRKNPSEDCCSGYAEYFGLNSTRPSRNCFCVPEVWAEFNKHSAMHRYRFADAFLYCRRFGYAIPAAATNGVGYCYGKDPGMEAAMAMDLEMSKQKPTTSVEKYFAKLNKDGLATVSFVTSVFSAIAFLSMLWPAMFDAAMSCIEYGKKRAAVSKGSMYA